MYAESKSSIDTAIATLKNRQNDDGSFGLWSGDGVSGRNNESDANSAYLTAYVAQFINIAKSNGFDVPKNMNARAIDYLRTFAGTNINNDFDAAAHAFAIYVLTRNGYITTGYIDAFEEYANENIKNWQSDLMGAYIATSYKMLKQDTKAFNLISKYRPSSRVKFDNNMFRDTVSDNANYAYLTHKYFGDKSTELPDAVSEYINDGDYTSYASAAILLATAGAAGTAQSDKITVLADGNILNIENRNNIMTVDIPRNAKQIAVRCETCDRKHTPYYTVISSGFPRTATSQSNGIEISREYFDENGNRITSATVGDTVTVKINIRSRRGDIIPNVVITDLVPGGFIPGDVTGDVTYSETREDRVLIFMDATRDGTTITYNAQLGAAGSFTIPAIHAESMYNPAINATGEVGKTFTVSNAFAE